MTIKQKDISSEHQVRLDKVHEITEKGIAPWPVHKPISSTIQNMVDTFIAGQDESLEYSVAGRLMTRRGHGKTVFAHIQDRTGRVQVYIKLDVVGEEAMHFFNHLVDVGDIVWCHGSMFTTKTGEATLQVKQCSLLSKCLHPLPEKYHGLTDTEQRYRQRHLDLMTNHASKEKFIQRSRIMQSVRNHLLKHDFLEVETPMLHPIPGGAAARPFITHHNAYDMSLYLRIAPELYLKRLVVGGLERVFEINRNFRNEGVSTRHNPEFTMLEFYMAYGDCIAGIALTEQMLHTVATSIHGKALVPYGEYALDFSAPFARYGMRESITKVGGVPAAQLEEATIDATLAAEALTCPAGASYGEKILALFEKLVEHKLIQPTFIIDFPIEISPLARRQEENNELAARFELFIAGMEVANGFSELNNPFDQADRFHAQVAAREAGNDEAHYFDADFVRALEFGLPPTVGVGIGIDRLIMLMTNTTSIKDVILFPTMRALAE